MEKVRDGYKSRISAAERKPGVKLYMVRFHRIEEGLRGHYLFSIFTAVAVYIKFMEIGIPALIPVIPPAGYALFKMLRSGYLPGHINRDAVPLFLNTVLIIGAARLFSLSAGMSAMGVVAAVIFLPVVVWGYRRDMKGAI